MTIHGTNKSRSNCLALGRVCQELRDNHRLPPLNAKRQHRLMCKQIGQSSAVLPDGQLSIQLYHLQALRGSESFGADLAGKN